MSNLKSRLERLETAAGMDGVKKYVCIIYPDQDSKGFDVSDFGGGNPQHFETRAELESFEARPDVELTIIDVVYASPVKGD